MLHVIIFIYLFYFVYFKRVKPVTIIIDIRIGLQYNNNIFCYHITLILKIIHRKNYNMKLVNDWFE